MVPILLKTVNIRIGQFITLIGHDILFYPLLFRSLLSCLSLKPIKEIITGQTINGDLLIEARRSLAELSREPEEEMTRNSGVKKKEKKSGRERDGGQNAGQKNAMTNEPVSASVFARITTPHVQRAARAARP